MKQMRKLLHIKILILALIVFSANIADGQMLVNPYIAKKVVSGGGGGAALPTTDLLFHYDASNAGSITSSSGLVSAMTDLSGNGRNLTSSGSQRPLWNGVDEILFDFSGGSSDDDRLLGMGTLTQPITIYFVGEITLGASGNYSPILSMDNGFSTLLGPRNFSGGQIRLVGPGGGVVIHSYTFVDNTRFVATAVMNGSSSTVKIDNGSTTTGTANGNPATAGIGQSVSSSGTMTFNEIIGYATATADDAGVRAYLLAKWGL